jgi:hypothetical protein
VSSHCIPSRCATVNYRPYQSGKVRWRYGTEPWQEYLGGGLSYTTKVSNNLIGTGGFKLIFQLAVRGNGSFSGWQGEVTSNFTYPFNSINDYCLLVTNPNIGCSPRKYDYGIWDNNSAYRQIGDFYFAVRIWANGQTYDYFLGRAQGIKVDFIAVDPAKRSTKCEFKIFDKNGTQIYSESRATCPQVQVIPCSLDPTGIKSIKLTKDKLISRVDVTNKSVTQIFLPPSNTPVFEIKDLPPECLNVYVASVVAPPFVASNLPSPGFELWDFKAQICSMVGCPPPTYEVLCEDCCESCPDGTCALECDGKICCYNDYGVSIREIELTNYCGGG